VSLERETIYVVLVNLNRGPDTIECLESLLRVDYPSLRIIVVDNGSTDDSVARIVGWAAGVSPYAEPSPGPLKNLSWPPVPKPVDLAVIPSSRSETRQDTAFSALTLITHPQNAGFGVASNIALRAVLAAATDGYALLLNNDMVVASDTVTALEEEIRRDPRVGAIGGLVLDFNKPDVVQMAGGATTTGLGMTTVLGSGLRRDQVPENVQLGFVGAGLLLIRLSTLRHVGLFDETFFLYGEDYDWGERMRSAGYRLTYTTRAVAWHKGSATVVRGSPFQDYHLVRGTLRFVRKHRPQLMPIAFSYSLIRSLAPKLVRRQWDRARAVLRAYGDHFSD
jgi:GT2 family glycosyltransferase